MSIEAADISTSGSNSRDRFSPIVSKDVGLEVFVGMLAGNLAGNVPLLGGIATPFMIVHIPHPQTFVIAVRVGTIKDFVRRHVFIRRICKRC